jgi:hypothetical protein
MSQRSNDYFAPTVVCNALNVCQRAQRSRARAGGTPDSQAGPQVRAPTVGIQRPGDVAGAPDTVRWRTGLSGAPCDSSLHQTASLVVGVINTPNYPTFKSSKFSTYQLLTRARHSIQDTPVGSMLRRRRSSRKKRLSAEAVCMRWPKVPLHEASVLQTDLKIE